MTAIKHDVASPSAEWETEAVPSKRPQVLPAHLLVAGTAWGSRLVNMGVQLVSLRLLLAGMGTDHYAVYALLNSLFAWYQLADLSIGYGLQNFISEHRAEGRSYHSYLCAAGVLGAGLLLLSAGVSCLASPWLGPLLLRHFSFLSPPAQTHAFLIVGLFFAVSGVAGMGMKAWYALQKGYVANLLTLLASVATLIGTLWAVQAGDLTHRLLWSLVALSAPPAAASCAAVWWLAAHEKPGRDTNRAVFSSLLNRGLRFWASLLLGMLLLKIDYIIIAQILPTHDMVVYNVADRIFGSAYALYMAATQALWPVAAEMIVEQKWDQLFRQLRAYILFGMLFILLVTLGMMLAAQPISHLLSPNEPIVMPRLLIAVFGVYYLVNVWTLAFSTVLYSKSDLKPFLACGAVQAVVGPPLQWFLAVHFGLYGILFGLVFIYLTTMAWVMPMRVSQYARGLLR